MKLSRLVEMIREDCEGIDDWPVMFASFSQSSAGEWQETDGREAITSVEAEIAAEEVLLIRAPGRAPLTVSSLKEQLSNLMESHSDFIVDTCESPIELDEGNRIHIDLPVVGAGRDDGGSCYLVVFASSKK
jgi:hypothetical protein